MSESSLRWALSVWATTGLCMPHSILMIPRKHLDYHVKPFICFELDCKQRAATGKDLKRHQLIHSDSSSTPPIHVYYCPNLDCGHSRRQPSTSPAPRPTRSSVFSTSNPLSAAVLPSRASFMAPILGHSIPFAPSLPAHVLDRPIA